MRLYCLCTDSKTPTFKEAIHYKNETVFAKFEGTVIGKCQSCGLFKTFPASKNILFNPIQSRGEFYEKNATKFIELFKPIVNVIKKYKSQGAVLDVGCSSGLLLSALKKERFEITGIEPHKEAYLRAKKRLGSHLFNGTLADYRKKYKNTFDVIIYNHVLEHISDVGGELKQINQALKKDGVLVVGVPNIKNVIFYIRQKYWESLMPNEHIWHFSPKTLAQVLDKYNFKIVDISFTDGDRVDYFLLKRLYFNILSFINRRLGTGEAMLVVTVKKRENYNKNITLAGYI